jgi:hypothetical protein
MADNLGSAIRDEILKFLGPFVEAPGAENGLTSLLQMVGHVGGLGNDPQLQAEAARLAALAEDLATLDDQDLRSWEGIIQVLDLADALTTSVNAIESVISDPELAKRAENLGLELAEHLLALYLRTHHPHLFRIAVALTLITPAELAAPEPMIVANGTVHRLPWARDRFHFDRIQLLLDDPLKTLNEAYLPGGMTRARDAHLAAGRLFPLLRDLSNSLQLGRISALESLVPPPSSPPDDDLVEPDQDQDHEEEDPDLEHPAPAPEEMEGFFRDYRPRLGIFLPGLGDEGSRFGFIVTASSAEHPDGIRGFVLSPAGDTTWSETREEWRLTFTAGGEIPAFVVGPDGIALAPLATPLAGGSAALVIERISAPGEPAFRLGASDGTRIEIRAFRFRTDLTLSASRQALSLSAEAESGALVLTADEGDGFLGALLPPEGVRVPFDLGIVLSSDRGLELKGGTGLELALQPHLALGPVSVPSLRLALEPESSGARFAATGALAIKLGPVRIEVEGLGLRLAAKASPEGGNFGPMDLAAELLPPTGASLAIDSDLVTGGGYLLFEPAKHRYAGALVLEIGEVTVNAVGLLTTRLPDGRQGYSLLIAISAAGFTPIQLGLGFTLNGVGGLLGVNRTVQVEVLRAGLKNNTLDAVLFPDNPLARLPQLVHSLEQVFPSTNGRYLFGPAAIIGWGTPTLLTLELALVLELPAPVRLVVLGRLQALLPRKEAPVVRLNMDALGVVDFTRGEASLDAVLYDSRLMDYALSGEMALRLRWESEPGFVLAVGGLNPRFNAPAALDLPKLARITIDFTRRDNPRLRLSAYLALTSNTLQLGALAELYVAVSKLSLQGALGFDVLIRLSPFGFVADLSGAVAVKWGDRTLLGVFLEASLAGPDPLVVNGKATVKVWIFSKSVDFDHTLGNADLPPPLPAADPLPDLVAALREPRNWSAQLPAGGHMLVALRQIPAESGVVLAHPLGQLTVTQNVVPLNLTIDRYGGAVPAGERRFGIDSVTLGSDPNPPRQTVRDWFAPGQFLDLSDTERLSRPSFEKLDAGLRIGGDEVAFGGANGRQELMAVAPVAYETALIDRRGQAVAAGSYTPDPVRLAAAVALGAVARKGVAHTGRTRYRGPAGGVTVAEAGLGVMSSQGSKETSR